MQKLALLLHLNKGARETPARLRLSGPVGAAQSGRSRH